MILPVVAGAAFASETVCGIIKMVSAMVAKAALMAREQFVRM